MTCVRCTKEFEIEESLIGDQGVCQLCWEKEVSDSWHDYMDLLAAFEDAA